MEPKKKKSIGCETMDQQNNWGRNQTPSTVRVRGKKLFYVTCLSEYL